ncbi:MAG: undecaprenyl/decaprenyl-phosphate alpha-N-acetylglucosaminyl 1-phosphate transferase [Anaerolineae bacterium]|nr:undecaprenyl/decaprenyl-phosphate alpha-N-acetylglucosaminyl 1-phosphate transferase [Anaerolineae bacterium]
MNGWMPFAVVFVTAWGLALIITPLAGRLGLRYGIADRPGGRRRHRGVISRLGGVALYLAFTAAILISLPLRSWLPPGALGPDPKEMTRLTALLVGSAFIFIFGLFDDRYELSPAWLYLGQIIAALIAIAGLVFIERVMNPFTNELTVFPWPLVIGFTLFWYVGMMNTVNFLDGLDGLAAGVAAITAAVLTLHMLREGQYSVALLPLALLGATLGFLPYNFHPARVFMGSCGALFLGFALAALSLIAGARVATILLVVGVPILDVAWQIFSRLRRRRPIAQGDRGHLHFRLLELGLSQRQIVGLYWGFSAAFGVLALTLSSRLYKLIAIVGLGVVALLVLPLISRQTPAE